MKFSLKLRPYAVALALLAITLLFSGCFQTDYLIEVKKDGSGTLTVTNGITREMMEQLRKENEGNKKNTPEEQKAAAEAFAAKLGEGVKVVSVEEIKTERIEGGKAIFSFADVTKLTIDTRDEMVGERRGDPETVTFEFAKGERAKLVARIHPRPAGPKVDPPEAPLGGTEVDALKGLKFRLALQVAGEIVETDAAYRDGPSRVILVDCLGEDLLKAQPEVKTNTPIGQGWPWMTVARLFRDRPGVKVEAKDTVTIEFK